MASTTLVPPIAVKGMTVWNPELFRCKIQVPYVCVESKHLQQAKQGLKHVFLKVPNTKCVVEDCQQPNAIKRVLLDPDRIKEFSDVPEDCRMLLTSRLGVEPQRDFGHCDFELNHSNFKPHAMLKAVLEGTGYCVSGFSRIGHIVHLNLKEELEPYKAVVGQIFLQLANVKTVVNKTSNIDNTFRNFAMETLAGSDADFTVSVRENGIKFEFDFSKVYWNPRLGTEHERVVRMLRKGDAFYDVFAGVGPFAVFAAMEGKSTKRSPQSISVRANDLNPESYKWLLHNMKLNKVADRGHVRCFNMDGAEFIRTEVRKGLEKWFLGQEEEEEPRRRIHIAMNLPATAIEFLSAFDGLLSHCDRTQETRSLDVDNLPLVHAYAFSSEIDFRQDLIERCELNLKHELCDYQVSFVRNVAPSTEMYRVSFPLTADMLFQRSSASDNKRQKVG